MQLDIALGTSRRQKVWKNRKIAWPDLVERLSTTTYTADLHENYLRESKDRQDEIKDVGAFVGGFLTNGRRTPVTNVKHRQILTLDLDSATPDMWENFIFCYDVEALVYSTHKHTPESPRLRLVLPIDRPVNIDEYEAIGRRLAEDIGINMFDNTGFQPQRLMYWPSTSKDGEFYFRHQKGPVLKADEVLASYTDWRDITSWAVPDNAKTALKTHLTKQADPRTKKGLVGAFCRTYTVDEAAEVFLKGVYTDAGNNRLTYTGGSTSAGAVIYNDGAFLYSHHNTDPCGNTLVNAFDLVRIHLFGDLDKDEEDTPITKKPSFKEMCEHVKGLPEVIKEIGIFDEPIQEGGLVRDDWRTKLTATDKGLYEATINNLVLIIANDDLLQGRIRYNSFENNIYLVGDVPWVKCLGKSRPFVDADDAGLRHYIERVYKIFHTSKTFDAVNLVALENSYHPIQDFINSEPWDGVKRVDTLLIDYMGAADSKYVRSVTRKFLTAAVARVFEMGVKFEYVLTLVGPQGVRKSTFFNVIGNEWFSDSFTTIQGKESYEQLQGVWIIEIAELAGFRKGENEATKHYIAKRVDRFRAAYGRRVENYPRQCVFGGTTNEYTFLKDHTGGRRYWPVEVTGKGRFALEDMDVRQVWAEAKQYYLDGERLWLEDEGILLDAQNIQSEHFDLDERAGVIEKYLDILLPKSWPNMNKIQRRSYIGAVSDIEGAEDDSIDKGTEVRDYVCVAEIWVELLGKEFSDMSTQNTKYIHQIMTGIKGWERCEVSKRFSLYGKQRTYQRIKDKVKA